MLTISVPKPHRWWAAVAADMPWLENPDLNHEDRDVPRWPDRDNIDWRLVAEQSTSALNQLQPAGRVLDEDGYAIVHVDVAPKTAEANILRSWFKFSEAPFADIWEKGLNNGRHRLWNGWKAFPEATFPIYSPLLCSTDDIPYMGPDFVDQLHDSAVTGLGSIPKYVVTQHPQTQEYLQHVGLI